MSLQRQLTNSAVNILYEIGLWFIGLIYIPKLIYKMLAKKKYRKSFFSRLGIGFPVERNPSVPLIWVHAVSFGETKAILPLARELKKMYPEMQLVISSLTETGHEEAKRSFPFADYHVYMPLDFYFLASRILSKASPDVVILCESDLWYNFLRCAKERGASIALVNAKLSERSLHRFKQVRFFSDRLFNLFDIICLQNALYKERFINLSVPEEKLTITGNLKLDEDYPILNEAEVQEWRRRLGIESDQIVLAVGSTHHPEEQMIIDVLKEIWISKPQLKLILVPRHPERFQEVADLLEKESLSFIRFTEMDQRKGNEKVVLIDTMGMLRMCYQLADIALVAGSYTPKVGGHNIIEPCWYARPVLFGPFMHTQMELVGLIKQYKAGLQVDQSGLKEILEHWIENPIERKSIGEHGLNLIRDSKGSVAKTIAVLKPVLDGVYEGKIKKEK